MKRDLVLEELVIEEATNLKRQAKKRELSELNYESLAGKSPYNCIYGLMTGDCESKRAYDLIKSCAKRVYSAGRGNNRITKSTLNGAPSDVDYSDRNQHYFSPIEVFVFKYKENHDDKSLKVKRLVSFLKGKTEQLTFN